MNLMIRSNLRMMLLLFEEITSQEQLDPKLLEILKQGFFECDGCYFLKHFYEKCKKGFPRKYFKDMTGYEAAVNEFPMNIFVQNASFAHTILFVKMLSIYWGELTNGKDINIIVAETNFGFNVRFYVVRDGEEYHDENLERYKEGVLILSHRFFYDHQNIENLYMNDLLE